MGKRGLSGKADPATIPERAISSPSGPRPSWGVASDRNSKMMAGDQKSNPKYGTATTRAYDPLSSSVVFKVTVMRNERLAAPSHPVLADLLFGCIFAPGRWGRF